MTDYDVTAAWRELLAGLGELDQRAGIGEGLHHMCPTSSGTSKKVGWR